MTVSLALTRDLIKTDLSDDALTQLINAVNADIVRLGGYAYPIAFSGVLADISIVSASGAASALSRSWLGSEPPIGSSLIMTTQTSIADVSYTLAAIDSGAVTITLEGDTPDGQDTLSTLADGALETHAFYIICDSGRIELAMEDAATADASQPDRVVWNIAATLQNSARSLLTGIAEHERVRFVIARARAGLSMPQMEWQAALDRIAISCLRIVVTDQAVMAQTARGGDVEQTRQYLQYSQEYMQRLSAITALTGAYFAP